MPYLPEPPSDAEKLSYANPRGQWLGLIGLIKLASFGYIVLRFASRSSEGSFHSNFAYAAYAVFALLYMGNISFWAIGAWFAKPLDYASHSAARDQSDYFPSVDVFLPNCGEPIEVIANQFKGVKALDYPNFTVWVLDDKGRDEIRMLAELHDFEYLSRPNKGELKKAGNLRYAFPRSSGELILVLDADFTPRPDYLKETVFRFAQNPRLGILQTPQYFANATDQAGQTPMQLGLGFFQEIFYRLIQTFRDRWGAAICCGSCATYRRSALEPHGGCASVHRSEDVHTAWMLLKDGWTVEYLALNLSAGLSPETVQATFNQHYRWCSGSFSLTCSKTLWGADVGLGMKYAYFSSFFYYATSALGTFFHTLPIVLGVWLAPSAFAPSGKYGLIGLPAIVLVLTAQAMWSKSRWGLSSLTAGVATMYTHLVALADVLCGDIMPWIPSGISSSSQKFERFVWLVALVPPFLLSIVLSLVIWRGLDWHRAIVPLGWMILQVVLSWSLLAEIGREMPAFRAID